MIRLPVDSTDDLGFGPAYAAALNGEPVQSRPKPQAKVVKAAPGSVRELCGRYSEFLTKDTTLSERTKYTRRRHLEEVCREVSTSGVDAGDMSVDKMAPKHVQQLLDRKRETPEASNDRRKALLALFKWAVPRGLATSNPAMQTAKIRTHSEGFATWKMEHLVRFGRQHVKDGALQFVQQKNESRSHKQMRIPIHPEVQKALDTVPTTQLTFLVTEFGRPFTSNGFGNWMRDKCDQAGLKGYSAQGLRKALQTMGADMNLTDRELMALAGHETTAMTTLYTKKRDRDLLAASGMAKLSKLQIGAPVIGFSESAPDRQEIQMKSTASMTVGAPSRNRTSTPCGIRF
jgi:hypothetical protein